VGCGEREPLEEAATASLGSRESFGPRQCASAKTNMLAVVVHPERVHIEIFEAFAMLLRATIIPYDFQAKQERASIACKTVCNPMGSGPECSGDQKSEKRAIRRNVA
jgi:hypothetical protein